MNGNTFQSRYIPQQAPLGISQYGTSPMHTIHDQSYGTGLSPETTQKIGELKKLLNKYPQYFVNSEEVIKWSVYWSVNGDNKILDENLERLRLLDSLANDRF
jgi:hypothetical protein